MEKKIKILVVDDHPIFLSGLKLVLSAVNQFQIIGEASDYSSAIDMFENHQPDIVITDFRLPEKNGIEVVKSVKYLNPQVGCILLTMYDDEEIFNEAMDSGVSAFLLKENAVEELISAVNSTIEGRHYISQTITHYLLERRTRRNQTNEFSSEIEKLTDKELTILKLISNGKTSKEIADLQCLSIKTIENHRTNISKKLQLTGSNSLIRFAIENKANID